jgi:outer membrane protein TolC
MWPGLYRGDGWPCSEGKPRAKAKHGDRVGVGVTLEYPLGNRQREAEHIRRRLERRRAVSVLHNTADQVAVEVKEKARKSHTRLAQVAARHEAVVAAQKQLKALEGSEPIRERLTPEFLLVKLQAQDTHATARRAELDALIEFNISLVELARATGTVLQLHRVEAAWPRSHSLSRWKRTWGRRCWTLPCACSPPGCSTRCR